MADRAFEFVAHTIEHVGCQGIIPSLLYSDANALQIESCNNLLTDLLALFNVRSPYTITLFIHVEH